MEVHFSFKKIFFYFLTFGVRKISWPSPAPYSLGEMQLPLMLTATMFVSTVNTSYFLSVSHNVLLMKLTDVYLTTEIDQSG